MMKGWKQARAKLPAKVKGHARFRARRRALAQAFPGEVLVIPTGREKVRNVGHAYRFRAGSEFYYLTGNLEPDCVLVLMPRSRGGHEDILFVEPNPGRSDKTFFTDKVKGELWVGPRLGVQESKHRYQVDRCEPLPELRACLKDLRGRQRKVRVLRGADAEIDRAVPANKKGDEELAAAIGEMRLIKDEMEVAAIKRACTATRHAFEDAIRTLKTATTEREIEGAFFRRARIEGSDVGFNIIAAAGEHACILHWSANDGRLRKRDLLLVDAGVESHEIYTGDITRTLPIGGRFSAAQREIYDLVIEAQDAALAAIKPGAPFLAPHRAATRTLTTGLDRLRLLPCSVEEALKPENQFYKRFTLHNTSHMLGLDVHDCSRARPAAYRDGTLEPGMVLTVEPGLYFQQDDLTVPARYRGIGVRVEDDVLVTTRGCRLLSDMPRASDDVERWMQRLWQQS
jgi:Xaa-Pro aminopeptidase